MASAAARRYIEIEVAQGKALRELQKMSKAMDETSKSSAKAARGITQVATAIKGIIVFKIAQIFFDLAESFVALGDASQDLEARLTGVADATVGAEEAFDDLFAITAKTGVSIEELGKSYTKLAIAVPTAEHEEITNVLDTVSTALATTGAGAQATNAVMLQLAQGMSAGALRGDELRSVNENLPVFLRAWADAAGRAGESVKNLGEQGFFTTESLLEFREEIAENVRVMTGLEEPPMTVARGFEVMKSGAIALVGGLNEATNFSIGFGKVLAGLGGVMKDVGDAAGYLEQNLEDVSVSFDAENLKAWRVELAILRDDIDDTAGAMEDLSAEEQERLAARQEREQFLAARLPEERRLVLQEQLRTAISERNELEREGAIFYKANHRARLAAMDKEIAELEELVAVAEKQIEVADRNIELAKDESFRVSKEEELKLIEQMRMEQENLLEDQDRRQSQELALMETMRKRSEVINNLQEDERREEEAFMKRLRTEQQAAFQERQDQLEAEKDLMEELRERNEEVFGVEQERLDVIREQAEAYRDQAQSAVDSVAAMQSAYDRDQARANEPSGAGGFLRLSNLISQIEAAVSQGNFGLAKRLQEEAKTGLQQFGRTADDALGDARFDTLRDRLEQVTLDVFTGVGGNMEATITEAMVQGFLEGKRQMEEGDIVLNIVGNIDIPLEGTVEQRGAPE